MPISSRRKRGGNFLHDIAMGPSDEKIQNKKDVFEIARESKGGGWEYARSNNWEYPKFVKNKPDTSLPKGFKRLKQTKKQRSTPKADKRIFAQQVEWEDMMQHIHKSYSH